ncbi:MAG: hypothetical protein A3E88_04810 [Legionellales bacterium RIFCSPHIGHO2_12_FULL_35_11]|nr:MAG: hypothetical protein A3E88_04810 [Legionellales bacterium RIFCSPHIGHO2_12_FULL_35_11]
MQSNPFSFLKETRNYPYARIRRAHLSGRLFDTWHVMAGRVLPEFLESHTHSSSFRNYTSYIGVDELLLVQSFGVVDYVTIGIFPLLHKLLKSCDAYIQNRCYKKGAIGQDERFIYSSTRSKTISRFYFSRFTWDWWC